MPNLLWNKNYPYYSPTVSPQLPIGLASPAAAAAGRQAKCESNKMRVLYERCSTTTTYYSSPPTTCVVGKAGGYENNDGHDDDDDIEEAEEAMEEGEEAKSFYVTRGAAVCDNKTGLPQFLQAPPASPRNMGTTSSDLNNNNNSASHDNHREEEEKKKYNSSSDTQLLPPPFPNALPSASATSRAGNGEECLLFHLDEDGDYSHHLQSVPPTGQRQGGSGRSSMANDNFLSDYYYGDYEVDGGEGDEVMEIKEQPLDFRPAGASRRRSSGGGSAASTTPPMEIVGSSASARRREELKLERLHQHCCCNNLAHLSPAPSASPCSTKTGTSEQEQCCPECCRCCSSTPPRSLPFFRRECLPYHGGAADSYEQLVGHQGRNPWLAADLTHPKLAPRAPVGANETTSGWGCAADGNGGGNHYSRGGACDPLFQPVVEYCGPLLGHWLPITPRRQSEGEDCEEESYCSEEGESYSSAESSDAEEKRMGQDRTKVIAPPASGGGWTSQEGVPATAAAAAGNNMARTMRKKSKSKNQGNLGENYGKYEEEEEDPDGGDSGVDVSSAKGLNFHHHHHYSPYTTLLAEPTTLMLQDDGNNNDFGGCCEDQAGLCSPTRYDDAPPPYCMSGGCHYSNRCCPVAPSQSSCQRGFWEASPLPCDDGLPCEPEEMGGVDVNLTKQHRQHRRQRQLREQLRTVPSLPSSPCAPTLRRHHNFD